MKKTIIPIALSLVLFACEKNETVSPGGGGGGGGQAALPTAYRINTIAVTQFNVNNSDGEGWDDDNVLTFGTADIYVEGYVDQDHLYTSEIEHNVIHTEWHNMNEADLGSLPLVSAFNEFCDIVLYDDDGAFGQDYIATLTLSGYDLYQDDEATTFSMTLTGNHNMKMHLSGEFSYQ